MLGRIGVPFNTTRSASLAVPPTDGTAVQALAAPWLDTPDGHSGFAALGRGGEALGARLRLIDAAERSVDLQSFLVRADMAGRLIATRLVAAAERGVRVRLLIDDVLTTVTDRQLAVLDNQANIEVRIFNPLARALPTAIGFLAGLPRTNRRMHNKAFIVDNAIAIVGGRNIADEYYEIEKSIEFADFDVMGAGPVAAQVSATFDLFWNSAFAVPVAALARLRVVPDPSAILAGPALGEARRIYEDAVASPILLALRSGRAQSETAPAQVVTDWPEKLTVPRGRGQRRVVAALAAKVAQAEREILIVSPYFVPRAVGVAFLKDLRARGLDVTIITNSLSSYNHPYVHGGYAPYRRDLLEMGVRLHESRSDSAISRVTGRPVRLTLHTKAVVVDRRLTFLGSLNLDPRSIDLNTEMGVFIESPAFARRLADAILGELHEHAYAVRLDGSGRPIWEVGAGETRQTWPTEPGASRWRRLVAWLARVLPVEGQL